MKHVHPLLLLFGSLFRKHVMKLTLILEIFSKPDQHFLSVGEFSFPNLCYSLRIVLSSCGTGQSPKMWARLSLRIRKPKVRSSNPINDTFIQKVTCILLMMILGNKKISHTNIHMTLRVADTVVSCHIQTSLSSQCVTSHAVCCTAVSLRIQQRASSASKSW